MNSLSLSGKDMAVVVLVAGIALALPLTTAVICIRKYRKLPAPPFGQMPSADRLFYLSLSACSFVFGGFWFISAYSNGPQFAAFQKMILPGWFLGAFGVFANFLKSPGGKTATDKVLVFLNFLSPFILIAMPGH